MTRKSAAEVKELLHLKTKLYNFVKKKNYSLEELFAILDKNKNNEVDLEEMINGLGSALGESGCTTLFRAIDIDRSNSLTIDELRQELDVINAALVLDKI